MTDDKKKVTYETREEQLINGNDLKEKAAVMALISGLSSRVNVCEIEILRLQNAIYSIEEEENLAKLKKQYQKLPGNENLNGQKS
jgi:hypothetical protein